MDRKKFVKKLGEDTVAEMEAMSPESLKHAVVEAERAMKTAAEELEANEAYQRVKFDYTILRQSKKDVDTRQKAKILLALQLLIEKGV